MPNFIFEDDIERGILCELEQHGFQLLNCYTVNPDDLNDRSNRTDKRDVILSDRNDIIVIVDEAHRTQYETLAQNMRVGLPNANYLAFTGTPLLGKERKTSAWFGGYVSEYNFSQSIDDGATVPLLKIWVNLI